MKTTRIGTLAPSSIALGSSYFGTALDEGLSFALLDLFAGAGGTCIDTARVYGAWFDENYGAAERTIGRFLALRGGRERFVLVTKGGHPVPGHMREGRLSRECLEDDLARSLDALGVPSVDLYLLHRDDPSRPVSDIMETLARFVRDGLVTHIGCSNWTAARIAQANGFARREGLPPFVTSQIQWSLAGTTPALQGDETLVCMNGDEYAWYLENRMPVMAFASQAKGFFAKGARDGAQALGDKARARFGTPENYARLDRVRRYSAERGLSPAAVALACVTSDALPAVAIVSASSVSQLADTLTAADLTLSARDLAYLRRGGGAPD